MKESRRILAILAVMGSLALFGSCAGKTKMAPGPDALDPKFALSSYIEEGELVALIVGARAAQFREDRPFIPLELAVVNKALPSLSLTRESFTLVDELGNEYPAVSGKELEKGDYNADLDVRLNEIAPVVRGRWQAFVQVPSNFTTTFNRAMERNANMQRFSYILDYLYFPHPETPVKGHRFELWMRAPELADPVFVRFAVGGKRLQEP
jgi:hypothetical protein